MGGNNGVEFMHENVNKSSTFKILGEEKKEIFSEGLEASSRSGVKAKTALETEDKTEDKKLSAFKDTDSLKKANIILETKKEDAFPSEEEKDKKKLRALETNKADYDIDKNETELLGLENAKKLNQTSQKNCKKKKFGFFRNLKGSCPSFSDIKDEKKEGEKNKKKNEEEIGEEIGKKETEKIGEEIGKRETEKAGKTEKERFSEIKSLETLKKKFTEIARKLNEKEVRTLPPYDFGKYGPLIEYEIPTGFLEIERYWVEEPYAFVSIIENMEMKYYCTVEPTLSAYEKSVLERVRGNLEDTLTQEDTNSGDEKEQILTNRALQLLEQYYSTLEPPSVHKIIYFLRRNFIGYERINPLILDPDIEDISCSGIGVPIYLYHRKYNNIVTNLSFGEKELNSLVVKLCQRSGKHISIGEPIVDATLPEGSRIQATLGREVTTRGSSYTIRKFKGDPITPIDLIKYGTCSVEMLAYYWIAIENNISALLAGGTASGKTSLMNAISLFIPRLSKIVSIEDTREIMLHHENWIAGATRKSFTVGGVGEVSMYELLKAALRQRPEYIIVGEVRGKEALTLFQAMSTGHTTYSTMHASDVQTVVNRLENEPINVPHVMMQALGIIAIQMQTYVHEVRVRRTKAIVEITGLDTRTGSLRINELYHWEPLSDNFKRAGDSYVLNEIMKARGWNSDKLIFEFKNRQKILAYMAETQIRDYVSVSLIVHMYTTNPQLVLEAIENDTLRNMVSYRS